MQEVTSGLKIGISKELGHTNFTITKVGTTVIWFKDWHDNRNYYVSLTPTGRVKKNSLRINNA